MPSAQRLFLISAVVLAIGAAGCGGDSTSSTTSAGGEGAATEKDWPVAEVGSKVSVPDAPPPKKLVVKDVRTGSGPPAKRGDEVEIQYVEADYATGEVVSVAVPGAPFHLKLDLPGSLPGREKGIIGMKVGGRRELFIPSRLGYGAEGSGSIPPNSALLLQVSLVAIN
jgi:peptidylprolyl isomerase